MCSIYKVINLFLFSFLFTTVFAQEIPTKESTWQEKLDFVKEGGYKDILTNNGLILVKYQVNDAIDPDSVKEKEIDFTTVLVIPQISESGYDNKFIVGTYSDKEVISMQNKKKIRNA